MIILKVRTELSSIAPKFHLNSNMIILKVNEEIEKIKEIIEFKFQYDNT